MREFIARNLCWLVMRLTRQILFVESGVRTEVVVFPLRPERSAFSTPQSGHPGYERTPKPVRLYWGRNRT